MVDLTNLQSQDPWELKMNCCLLDKLEGNNKIGEKIADNWGRLQLVSHKGNKLEDMDEIIPSRPVSFHEIVEGLSSYEGVWHPHRFELVTFDGKEGHGILLALTLQSEEETPIDGCLDWHSYIGVPICDLSWAYHWYAQDGTYRPFYDTTQIVEWTIGCLGRIILEWFFQGFGYKGKWMKPYPYTMEEDDFVG